MRGQNESAAGGDDSGRVELTSAGNHRALGRGRFVQGGREVLRGVL